MSVCVNTSSKQFQLAVQRLNIHPNNLELIVHEYINKEGNEDSFPTDAYIRKALEGKTVKTSKAGLELWGAKYSTPKVCTTLEEAQKVISEAEEVYPKEAISTYQVPEGSYVVSVAKPVLKLEDKSIVEQSVEHLKSIGIEVHSKEEMADYLEKYGASTVQQLTENAKQRSLSRLRPEYRGKLIFAQTGTGKSTIADNIGIIDSDFLLGQVLGVSAETAGFFFGQMSKAQKQAFGEKYRNLIKQKVAEGFTVLTANLAMLEDADVIVHNESAELTDQRTNSKDRAITNRFINTDYAEQSLALIEELKQNEKDKSFISLNDKEYLSDFILSDSTDIKNNNKSTTEAKRNRNTGQRSLTKEELIGNFLKEFGITVNTLESYNENTPLFENLNRVINVTDPSEITDGMGYAIAFMMQADPEISHLINMRSGSNAKYQNNIRSTINRRIGSREEVIQNVGRRIAEELRRHFGEDVRTVRASSSNRSIWKIIKNFIGKLFRNILSAKYKGKIKKERELFVKDIIDALSRGDFSRIKGPLVKPGTTEKAELVDIEQAFLDNPFEASIIKKLGDNGIALAGSASIALEGPLYRPKENPLHDIDFNAGDNSSKETLDALLPRIFGEDRIAFSSMIARTAVMSLLTGETRGNSTVTYVTLDRPFEVRNHRKNKFKIFEEYYDKEGNYLGKREGSDLYLEDGVKGKLLDFFVGKEVGSAHGAYTKNIGGTKYLLSRSNAAMAAKVLWARPKDLWDYKQFKKRAVPQGEAELQMERQGMTESLPFFTTPEGEIYGFITPEGEMYLDETVIKEEHPIHEYTHLWDRAVQRYNPKLWKKGVSLMQQISLWDEIANSEQYGIKWSNSGIEGQHLTDLIASEVHSRLVGKEGADILRNLAKEKGKQNIIQKLAQWLKDFWKNLKSTFGVWSDEDINALTLEEINMMTVRDFTEGTPLNVDTNNSSYYSTEEIQREMEEIKQQAIADGTFMKAPNGKPTNLNERQWLQVRTKEFKEWFGDWESVAPKISKELLLQNGNINWNYFEQVLDAYHNSQPNTMFAKGRYTLATREEKHFTGEKNTLNHIKFVTQSMLNLLEGKFDVDLPFVSEARASLQNQKDLMVLAAMFHDVAKPYRHGDIHGWESADILRDVVGIDYNNRLAEWAIRHHMVMPFSHKAEFSLSNPDALEVAKNMARDAKRIGIDAQTAINAFVLINAADIINGREITTEDNWAKKAKAAGNTKFGDDISVKAVLTTELKEKVDLLKKAFEDIKDEHFGNPEQNYRNQSRFDYASYPEGGRADGKLPYLGNIANNNVSKVVDENGEPLVVYHGTKTPNITIFDINKTRSGAAFWFANDNAQKLVLYSGQESPDLILMPLFVNIKNPLLNDENSMEAFAAYDEHDGGLILGKLKDFKNDFDEEGYKEIISKGLNDNSYIATGNVSNPNQFKSATDNVGTFSKFNNDIQMAIEKGEPTDNEIIPTYEEEVDKVEIEEGELNIYGNTLSKEQVKEDVRRANEHIAKQQALTAQINDLFEDSNITASEVQDIAEQAVFWISDYITTLQTDPKAIEDYGETALKDKDISTMSRSDIAKAIGVNNLLNRCKEVFSPKNNEFDDLDFIDKAWKIIDNWEAIITWAQPTFLEVEEFSIVVNNEGELEVNTDLNEDADNFNLSRDEATVKEMEGNLQEHWQVEIKTLDIVKTMSQRVKQALRQCYITDNDGNILTSDFGVKRRLTIREATNSILRWTQGALTLNDMIIALQDKQNINPWVKQLLERLTDDSGNETTFQSEFFSNFNRPFQSYSVVTKEVENGKVVYKSVLVNENPALSEAMTQISTQYKIGEHPLFTSEGINKETLNTLKKEFEELAEFNTKEQFEDPKRLKELAINLGFISNLFGYYVLPDTLLPNLNEQTFKDMYSALFHIMRTLESNKDKKDYNPFAFDKNGINGNLRAFLKPITEFLEDTHIAAFYDSGKMYQSYIIPSYTTKLMNKFKLKGEEFDSFIQNEFAKYEWFHTGNSIETGWRNDMLNLLVNDSKAREILKHKVQLNFNKKNYMRTMSDAEYVLSLLTEYWSEDGSKDKSMVPAWFRMPMLSNKPSSEYIRFYSRRGSNYKESILNSMLNIFQQELSRIQTVYLRNYKDVDPQYIKNFDKNGRKFCFLEGLNVHLEDQNSEIGKLIRDKIAGKEVDDVKLNNLVLNELRNIMENRTKNIIRDWEKQGILENAKAIKNVGTTEEEVKASLENFIWNDTLMSMNIMQLFITDIAYYKDAEDLQKRLAQIHAPGIRGNIYATDFKGKPVSDGIERALNLKDFEGVVSNIIDNVSIVFDRKIAAAKTDVEKNGLIALKESLVRPRTYNEDGTVKDKGGDFYNINVTDAQAYNSPTSYRKKALMFGKWSKAAEQIYEKIRKGDFSDLKYSDIKMAFQVQKPFMYTQMEKSSGVAGPMSLLKAPVQNKNSEYLLILADAILQGENTGKPNILRAIYEVMEESHYVDGNIKTGEYKTNGIDTVQFGSAVKSSLTGEIDLTPFMNDVNGEEKAKAFLRSCIYETERSEVEVKNNETGEAEVHQVTTLTNKYNKNYVNEFSFEDYCLQQEVPEHFKDHMQVHGSQLRYIVVSELQEIDDNGNEIKYKVGDEEVNAKEYKKIYEDLISKNIEESIDELVRELNLDYLPGPERNAAISKLLQREILSSPRYGVDLYLACSLDANGEFRMPLGDPIQSKRIEQLLNSVIKNRVNKQKIAGGPVVQVSNFGTSRQLNIKFKDKVNGGLLMTREEWSNSKDKQEKSYEDYIKNNQGGIAYFEVFAPMYTEELFSNFIDNEGNIDIKTIEQLNPELLKMIGYRIPTEAKYSMAPMKIVGFLPREAGDAIMMPYDITLLNGSDFDVDKMYLMRKEFSFMTKFDLKPGENMSEAEKDYFEHNKSDIREHLRKTVDIRGKVSQREVSRRAKESDEQAELEKRTALRVHNENLNEIESRFSDIEDAIGEKSGRKEKAHSKKADRDYYKAIKEENRRYKQELKRINSRRVSNVLRKITNERIEDFLRAGKYRSSVTDDVLDREIRKAYLDYTYKVAEIATGRAGRNNQIIDMTYEILTHETSAHEILNPGGFNQQRRMGYLIEAYKTSQYSWEELNNMSIEELKDIAVKGKNLSYIDTQVQFYKQNNAAGSLISIFAVNRTAHAILENDGYRINVDDICKNTQPFIIAGKRFGGLMEVDVRANDVGESVGKVLGSLVASSVDAVKDPVLNLMNINKETANILNTLVRLGMPFEDSALLLSQKSVSDILQTYYSTNISRKTSLYNIIKNRITKIEKDYGYSKDSPILKEAITKEELIAGLKTNDVRVEYKVLNALNKIQLLANVLRGITATTRFNSEASAVGPLIIDNLMTQYQMERYYKTIDLFDTEGEKLTIMDIFKKHPILNSFYKTGSIANEVFGNMPANSTGFRNVLDLIADTNLGRNILSDKKLLSALSDFYQSHILISSGVIDESRLKEVITEFPKKFMQEDIKSKYKDNYLIQSIKYNTDKEGRLVLNIDTTGIDTTVKQKLESAWVDLHEIDPKLSRELFEYCFFRAGIGFSPKTFMNLVPLQVKEQISGYVEAFRHLPSTDPYLIVDQFVRNKWNNDSIVPTMTLKYLQHPEINSEKGTLVIKRETALKRMEKVSYFKIKTTRLNPTTNKTEEVVNLYKQTNNLKDEKGEIWFEKVSPLGSNGDYVEISKNEIQRPMSETVEVKEEEMSPELERTSPDEQIENDITEPITLTEQQHLDDLLLQAFKTKDSTDANAQARLNKFKNYSEADKRALEKQVKGFIERRFDGLGIEYNEELIDKLYKRMC